MMKLSVGLSDFSPSPVAIFFQKKADFVVVPIVIKSEQKHHQERLREINKARSYLTQEAKKYSYLSIVSGAKQVTNIDKLGMLSSGQTSSSLLIRAKLSSDVSDLFIGAELIQQFIDGLNFFGKIDFHIGDASLEVENAELYRETLLSLIQEHMVKTFHVMPTKSLFSIGGLESPIFINQLDECNVGLFIKYSLTLNVPSQ